MLIGNQNYFTKTTLSSQNTKQQDISFNGKGKGHKWAVNAKELPVISEEKDMASAELATYQRRFSNIVKKAPREEWQDKLLPVVTQEAKKFYSVTNDATRIKKQAFILAISEYFTPKKVKEILTGPVITPAVRIQYLASRRII